MPRILIIGLVAGLFGGLMWGGFHNLFTVPVIERAIVFEEERSSALNPNAPEEEPLVPLGAQRVGMVIGTGFFGAVWGIVFAAGYTVIRRLAPDWKPLAIVVAVAALGYWAVSLFPFIRYPLNPPGVGEEGTVVLRQGLQLMFMVLSVIGVGVLLYGLREINQRSYPIVYLHRHLHTPTSSLRPLMNYSIPPVHLQVQTILWVNKVDFYKEGRHGYHIPRR